VISRKERLRMDISIKIVAAPADRAEPVATPSPELLYALATALTARAAVAAALPADAAARAAVQADSRRCLETTPEGAALTAATHARDAAEDAERAADGYFEHVLACLELDHIPDGDSSVDIESARSALRAATAARDASVVACCAAQEAFSACIHPQICADFSAADAALCAAVKEARRADAALQAVAARLGWVVSIEGLEL